MRLNQQIKSIPKKKRPALDKFIVKFDKNFEELTQIILKISPKYNIRNDSKLIF
jgi:hypothetical protein